MNYFEKLLLNYLLDSEIEMEINGFDMEGFEQILNQELKCRLEMIESVVFLDTDTISNAEKIAAIKELFRNEFYNEE